MASLRRTPAAVGVALALALTLLPAGAASADDLFDPAPFAPVPAATGEDDAEQALATVTELLAEEPAPHSAKSGDAEAPHGTLAMRDLLVALPRLDPDEQARARDLMARPTDGADDRLGDGYAVPSRKKCGKKVCVHYVTSTADAPPSKGWVRYNLKLMDKVWKHQVGKLGFRKPLGDRRAPRNNGGNGKFDVYLKDLGGRGLYGYCVPEWVRPGRKYAGKAMGYCVLDNDFARAQFGTAPKPTLKVTAAHEFFHAVQFAYDYTEDRWLLESTATWMEERFADKVNDNRQFLPSSQVQAPWLPLDTFSSTASNQYGNWVFWEYLGGRFGKGIVKDVWKRASPKGRKNPYSTGALKKVLKRRGGFDKVYRSFAAANVTPGRTYPEGKSWPEPPVNSAVLQKSRRSVSGSVAINHLAAQHARVVPGKGLRGKRWKVRIRVDGPSRKASPGAVVTVRKKSGKVERTSISLNRKGKGKTKVAFGKKSVRSVTITLVNASTRFRCGAADPAANPQYSCRGLPRDDAGVFSVAFKAIKR
ncbi:MXAN_6640 family putative metalloprotease [Nocardioides dongkuii]|uniref:MXAN_6640 family putative metalloprotease n=1 Tax=Nocardioides dongkuii TaxID=2760089 RepID=UPI0015F8F1A7|nr:MXAN_6640 family putative metalloprotease [Nocardioides dongkuii]